MKAKNIVYLLLFVIAHLAASCGDFNGDDRDSDGFAIPLAVEEINLTASIDFEPVERESGDYELGFNATLVMPLELSVLSGNSGIGFASISVAGRKYCYRGNALDENDPSGNAYFFVYEKRDPISVCSIPDGGETSFRERVEVSAGDVVMFEIESLGCSLENETCVFTEARAVIDVEDTEL